MQFGKLLTLGLILGLLSNEFVSAGVITFDLKWSATPSSGGRIAFGKIAFDDLELPNPGNDSLDDGFFDQFNAFNRRIADIRFKVKDSDGTVFNYKKSTHYGNGTSQFVWNTDATGLDFGKELIGQETVNGRWGIDTGTFDLIGTDFFGTQPSLVTSSGSGVLSRFQMYQHVSGNDYYMNLTSMRLASAPIPEPSTLAIFGIGSGLIWFKSRRRK